MKKILYFLTCIIIVNVACGTSNVTPAVDSNTLQTAIVNTAIAALNLTQTASVPTNTLAPTNTPEPINTPIPSATPNLNLVSAGTYLVGVDIQPGFYKGVTGGDILDSCYWARLSDLSGSVSGILANDNSIGQFYVEIKQTDYAFETGCRMERLENLPEPISEFPTKIAPGTYLVGREIQPGIYKGQAGSDILESCYWVRLSNVAGEFDAILANDNAVGQYYVQVSQSDFAVTTACELEWVSN